MSKQRRVFGYFETSALLFFEQFDAISQNAVLKLSTVTIQSKALFLAKKEGQILGMTKYFGKNKSIFCATLMPQLKTTHT